jgi:hypothetical protein
MPASQLPSVPRVVAPALERALLDPGLLPFSVVPRDSDNVDRAIGDIRTDVLKPGAPYVQHHRRDDRATTQASYDKRFKIASPEANAADIREDATTRAMKVKFHMYFGDTHSFSPVEFDQCVERSLDSWLAKRTRAAALEYVKLLNPEVPVTHISTFLKAQVLKKLEKVNEPAVAGQIISSPPFLRHLVDNAYALYLERVLMANVPDNVYLHLRRSPASLADWVSKAPATSSYTMNDWSAWDSGIDGAFLSFDMYVLRWLGLPADYLRFFVAMRIGSFNFLGNVKLMQLSGDRYTFLLNTLRNLCLCAAIFLLTLAHYLMVAGDDVLLFGFFLAKLRLKLGMSPKIRHGPQGEFVSFLVANGSVAVDGRALYLRVMIARDTRALDQAYYLSLVDAALTFAPPVADLFFMPALALLHHDLQRLGLFHEASLLSASVTTSPSRASVFASRVSSMFLYGRDTIQRVRDSF